MKDFVPRGEVLKWWEKPSVLYADDSIGSDFTSLATTGSGSGSLNFPSIYHQSSAAGGNQLIGSDPNNSDLNGGGGDGAPGGPGITGGDGKSKGRKKLRLLKPKLKQLYDMEVLPVEYMGPKIEYTYVGRNEYWWQLKSTMHPVCVVEL